MTIRYARPKGNTFTEMQENVRNSELYEYGDATLVWVNEGDFWIAGVEDKGAERKRQPQPEPEGTLQLVRVPPGKAIMFCDVDHPPTSGVAPSKPFQLPAR